MKSDIYFLRIYRVFLFKLTISLFHRMVRQETRRGPGYVSLKLFQLGNHCVCMALRFGSFPPILCVQSRKIFSAKKHRRKMTNGGREFVARLRGDLEIWLHINKRIYENLCIVQFTVFKRRPPRRRRLSR